MKVTANDILKLRFEEGLTWTQIRDRLDPTMSLHRMKSLLRKAKAEIKSIEEIPHRREADHYPLIKLKTKAHWSFWSHLNIGQTYAVSKNVLAPFDRVYEIWNIQNPVNQFITISATEEELKTHFTGILSGMAPAF